MAPCRTCGVQAHNKGRVAESAREDTVLRVRAGEPRTRGGWRSNAGGLCWSRDEEAVDVDAYDCRHWWSVRTLWRPRELWSSAVAASWAEACHWRSARVLSGLTRRFTGGVLKKLDFFLLRTALRDRPKGPSTGNHQPPANHHQPPTANRRQPPAATNRQPPTNANGHQPPIPNHQPPPTATNRQSPTATRPPPTHGVPAGFLGNTV